MQVSLAINNVNYFGDTHVSRAHLLISIMYYRQIKQLLHSSMNLLKLLVKITRQQRNGHYLINSVSRQSGPIVFQKHQLLWKARM